jgi:hypothetical protein
MLPRCQIRHTPAVLLCIALWNSTAAGSEALPTLDGLAIIKSTIAASGGNTWQQPRTLWLRGDATFTPEGRAGAGSRLELSDYAMYRVFPSDNDGARQANGKVRFDAGHVLPGKGRESFMRLIFDGKESKTEFSELAKPWQKHFSWSNNFGFGILRFADREGFKVERLADDLIDGHAVFTVRITDPKKMLTTFFIDQKTRYIRSVAFTTDVGFHQRIYSDFTKAPNVDFVQPQRLRIYFDGILWFDIRWREFKVNEPIADAVFAAQTAAN